LTQQETELIKIICPAIQSRKLVRIWYQNTTSGLQDWRTIEPYLIGSFPRKHIQLSAWFLPTSEQAQVGQKEGWRNYVLRNISDVQAMDEVFTGLRQDYDPAGSGMTEIFCAAKKEVIPFMRIS
jgi:predicted DNA-binding transcriptional regulator YafY